MSVKVRIFYSELRAAIEEQGDVWVDGATVGECLKDLVKRHPGVERLMFDSRGRLLKRVYVFVNAEGMQKAEFARPVSDRDELIVAVLASGG
jgi:molybdopterin converting factor small subunit